MCRWLCINTYEDGAYHSPLWHCGIVPDYVRVYMADGDPYLKHITECVELITAEVKRQLASDTQRPPGFSAKRGKRLAGSFVDSAGIVGAVKRMFQGGSGAPQSGEVAGQGDQSAGMCHALQQSGGAACYYSRGNTEGFGCSIVILI